MFQLNGRILCTNEQFHPVGGLNGFIKTDIGRDKFAFLHTHAHTHTPTHTHTHTPTHTHTHTPTHTHTHTHTHRGTPMHTHAGSYPGLCVALKEEHWNRECCKSEHFDPPNKSMVRRLSTWIIAVNINALATVHKQWLFSHDRLGHILRHNIQIGETFSWGKKC